MMYGACGGCSDRLLLADAWPFSIVAAALMLCVHSSRPMETGCGRSPCVGEGLLHVGLTAKNPFPGVDRSEDLLRSPTRDHWLRLVDTSVLRAALTVPVVGVADPAS